MQNLSEQTPTTQRFDGVIKRDVISDMKVGIIGLGAVGNPLSRIIAGMKPGGLFLMDPDRVGPENVGPQLYSHADVGRQKLDVCIEVCDNMNPQGDLQVTGLGARFPDKDVPTDLDVLFMCVDSMHSRREIHEYAKDIGAFAIDCRMGLETYIITNATADEWLDTWFEDEDGIQEACNARATPWCATMCASHAVHYWSRYLRGMDNPFQIIHDLNTLEVVPVND